MLEWKLDNRAYYVVDGHYMLLFSPVYVRPDMTVFTSYFTGTLEHIAYVDGKFYNNLEFRKRYIDGRHMPENYHMIGIDRDDFEVYVCYDYEVDMTQYVPDIKDVIDEVRCEMLLRT